MPAFQQGFKTLSSETVIESLPLKGKVPEWLDGFFMRNGPAMFETSSEQYQHWFDGQGMLHQYKFSNGNISYRNRYIRSRGYETAVNTGRIRYHEFGTAPKISVWRWLMTLFKGPTFSQNPNICIIDLNGNLVALTETPEYVQIDPETLDRLGFMEPKGRIPCEMALAHTLFDNRERATYNVAEKFGMKNYYVIYKIPYDVLEEIEICRIPVKRPGYMHAFSMTERYIILIEYPLRVNPLYLKMSKKPFITTYKWEENAPTRFIVIDKNNGDVVALVGTDPFMFFHPVNAFDDTSGNVIVDIPAYTSTAIVDKLYLGPLRGDNGGDVPGTELRRYTLSLQNKKATFDKINDDITELNRINDRYSCVDYQFGYAISQRADRRGDFFNQLSKFNVKTGESQYYYDDNGYYQEPVFVPSPNAENEDDGVVLSVVLDGVKETSYLVVLDGSSFTELARGELPHHVPFGLHGNWFQCGQVS